MLENFGPPAMPLLVKALTDNAARRAAAMSLGRVGDVSALPALTRELADPANKQIRTELITAIRDITIRAGAKPRSPELAAQIQGLIDALQPDSPGEWPIRVCKVELNALPLHGTLIYLWAIQPDGTVLCMDHEAFGHPTEIETDPLVLFAVVFQGARTYPELLALLPPPPTDIRPCETCQATGQTVEAGDTSLCFSCNGLGWLV